LTSGDNDNYIVSRYNKLEFILPPNELFWVAGAERAADFHHFVASLGESEQVKSRFGLSRSP
jgi:hypothetical protein